MRIWYMVVIYSVNELGEDYFEYLHKFSFHPLAPLGAAITPQRRFPPLLCTFCLEQRFGNNCFP